MIITQYNYIDDTELPGLLRQFVKQYATQMPTPVSEGLTEAAQRLEAMIDYIEAMDHGDDS